MQYVPKWCMLHFSKIKIGSVKPLLIRGNGDLDTLLHTGLKNWFAPKNTFPYKSIIVFLANYICGLCFGR